jgi:putative flippase GtrA
VVIRWLKFNAVGILGAGVQLAVLWLLVRFGLHYLFATGLAVETAVLHNYAWHVRWTWADRPEGRGWIRLWRFHLANGFVSILSNLALMRVFAGWLGIPVLGANVLAIALTSVVNFLLGDRWVFLPKRLDRRL